MRLLYIDENDFNKKLRSLKIYCPIAYKQLIFKVKKELDASVPDGIYRRELKASKEFKFVY